MWREGPIVSRQRLSGSRESVFVGRWTKTRVELGVVDHVPDSRVSHVLVGARQRVESSELSVTCWILGFPTCRSAHGKAC